MYNNNNFDEYKIFNFTEDYTANELITKYLLILDNNRPFDNMDNIFYNENLFVINNSFVSLSYNCNFEDVSDEKIDYFLKYLSFFVIKYDAFIKNKNDHYYETNIMLMYSFLNKFKKNRTYKKQLVSY